MRRSVDTTRLRTVSKRASVRVSQSPGNSSSSHSSCLNCRFYEPGAHNECYIPNTEWVGDKAGGNFCDEFEFADREPGPSGAGAGEQARTALDRLFGDAGDRAPESDRLDTFRKLLDDESRNS